MLSFGFGFKSVVLLIFFIHGLVYAGIIWVEGVKQSEKSSQWLSFLLILCCLYISPFMLGYAGWYSLDGYREFLFYVPLQQLLIIGPVTYFYVRSLLHQTYRLSPKDYLHFLPGIIYNLYIFLIFILDLSIYDGNYFYENGRDKDLDLWYQLVGFLSMLVYFSLSLRLYWGYKSRIYNIVSYADEITYKWVARFLIALLLLLMLRITFFIVNPEWAEFGSKFWYYAWFSVILYTLGILGYRHSIKRTGLYRGIIENEVGIPQEDDNQVEVVPEKSTSLEDLELWKEKLEKAMRDNQLYTDPQLTLLNVSGIIGTNARNVSQIVNQGFGMNFNDFVNQHRSKAMVEKIENNEHQNKTLLALAYECGFNSKSTFNRAFKKYTGKTPMQFTKDSD